MTRRNKLLALVECCLFEGSLADAGWCAAVVSPTGDVFCSDCHHDAYEEAGIDPNELIPHPTEKRWDAREQAQEDGWREGFVGPEGKFHTREEALTRWRAEAGFRVPKTDKGRDWGDSSDLYPSNYGIA